MVTEESPVQGFVCGGPFQYKDRMNEYPVFVFIEAEKGNVHMVPCTQIKFIITQ